MAESLAGAGGYYRDRDPLGAAGDFVTAPEISQMFGELVGLWAVASWAQMGCPDPFHLVELGPGRGTLMADALRAASQASAFLTAKRLHLIEINENLRRRQQENLAAHDPNWHDDFATLPEGPALIIANEFFDALPIHQFVMTSKGWRERLITVDRESGRFTWSVDRTPSPQAVLLGDRDASTGSIAEISPAGLALISSIADRCQSSGGAALIVDYGYADEIRHATFQAVRGHRAHDPLEAPGEADLTAHVDFAAMASAAIERGARAWGPVGQGEFLEALGIRRRADALKRSAPERADAVETALHRLIHAEEMGTLFKALAVTGPKALPPAGFEGV